MTKIDGLTCKKAHCKCMNRGNQCTNHHYADSCFGEKPVETWEERLYALGNECSFDWDGAPERLESFIASEIQSAVEAERRRIAVAMEGERLNEMDSWDVSSKKVLSIINPKK